MQTQLVQKIKTLKPAEFTYSTIVLIFIISIIAIFIVAARFLSGAINDAISPPDTSETEALLTRVSMADYVIVGRKLHLPIEQTPGSIATTTPAATETPVTPAAAPQQENKADFTVAIFNSTKKSGLAGELGAELTSAGFAVAKTGNQSPVEPQTRIRIKERVQTSPQLLEELTAITKKHFIPKDPEIIEEESLYDMVIIIGSK